MGCDLFNNSNGGYINPGLSPCAGDGGDNNLEFVDKGIGIVSGSEIKSFMDFSDLSIPADSWNQQIQSLGPGEVIFIQGLTKGLTKRQQGYIMPTLNSTDEALNPFFMEIDLSINYYYNFAFIKGAIDVSSNYSNNIDIATAINLEFTNDNIKVTSSYDPSALSFIGDQEGYQFDISSVYLSVIDASQDINSPFPPYIVDGQRVQQIWKLEENLDLNIPSAKYPNTASQGIILKTKYPSDAEGNYVCDVDKWIYVNHAANTVDICDEIELTFNTDVSCVISIAYDNSTFLGIKPIIIDDVSIADASAFPYPEDPSSIIVVDGSILIDGAIINNFDTDTSTYTIIDSSITDSSILSSSVFYGIFEDSYSLETYFIGTEIANSELNSTTAGGIISSTVTNSILGDISFEDSLIIDSSIVLSNVKYGIQTDVSGGVMTMIYGRLIGDPSAFNYIQDTSIIGYGFIKNYDLSNITVDFYFGGAGIFGYNISLINAKIAGLLYVNDSSMENIISADVATDAIYIFDSFMDDSSIVALRAERSVLNNITLDASIINTTMGISYINDSEIYDSSMGNLLLIQDTSIFTSYISASIDKSEVTDSSIHDSLLINSEFILSTIWDSSIVDSTFNQGTKVSNSWINNSWSNVFVLVTNPSTGEKIYVMDDPTLPLDSSAWRVNIDNALIWDSSFNNTTIYDSSIYRTYLQDSSLIRCTTYNCTFDESVEYDTRTIMIDASISSDSSISFDTSTFYTKTTKNVEVGLSGCSSDESISAGDYLNWVTTNDLWKKIGDLYAWTSAPDDSNSTNLIPGFYVYNAHTFPVSIEYMVFV